MKKEIFEKSTDGMLIIENAKFIDCNDSVVKMLRYENKEQLLNTHPSQLSPEFQADGRASYEKAEEHIQYVLANGNRTFEWIHLRADGEPFWVEVVLTNISDDDNILLLTVWREIGEKKRLEAENIYQHMILNSVLNSTKDLIFYKDYINQDGKYVGCNDAFGEYLGKSKEEIVGKDSIELFGKLVGNSFRENDLEIIKNKEDITYEKWVVYPNGSKVLLRTQKSILLDEHNAIIGIMGIARDITTEYSYKRAIEEKMRENELLAKTDALTGVGNRRSFYEIAEKLMNLSQRNSIPLVLMMIDIDFFKKVNDQYGHLVGDEVLKYVAHTIAGRLRESDVICRFGGEEFIVLLSGADINNALVIAEEIRLMFSNHAYSDGEVTIPIHVSIGVGEHKNEVLMKEFIQRVDENLYKAKEKGRNRVESD